MKFRIGLAIGLLSMMLSANAQQSDAWVSWSWLIGEWKGEGTGVPGKGSGQFSFHTDLDQKILVRKAHAEYPTENGKAVTHDDLLFVYLDASGVPSRAIYFDNEGHTINYTISYTGNTIVLLGDKVKGFPVFRLTYVKVDDHTVHTKFEMSRDGVTFMTYVEGESAKVGSQK